MLDLRSHRYPPTASRNHYRNQSNLGSNSTQPVRYNIGLVFRPLALSVCLAVLAAFCNAPFVHFHAHATSEHARSAHDGRGLAGHAHPAATPTSSGPELQANSGGGDDAVFLTWLQSTPQAKPVAVVGLQPVAPVLTTAFVVVGSVMLPSPRSHDPPHLSSTSPRSPPDSLPSLGA